MSKTPEQRQVKLYLARQRCGQRRRKKGEIGLSFLLFLAAGQVFTRFRDDRAEEGHGVLAGVGNEKAMDEFWTLSNGKGKKGRRAGARIVGAQASLPLCGREV